MQQLIGPSPAQQAVQEQYAEMRDSTLGTLGTIARVVAKVGGFFWNLRGPNTTQQPILASQAAGTNCAGLALAGLAAQLVIESTTVPDGTTPAQRYAQIETAATAFFQSLGKSLPTFVPEGWTFPINADGSASPAQSGS